MSDAREGKVANARGSQLSIVKNDAAAVCVTRRESIKEVILFTYNSVKNCMFGSRKTDKRLSLLCTRTFTVFSSQNKTISVLDENMIVEKELLHCSCSIFLHLLKY